MIEQKITWARKYWRLLSAAAIATLAIFAVHGLREAQEQRKRNATYEAVLRSYSQALKPGITREEVEDYLRQRNAAFRFMCCVDFKSSKSVWDDLVKIGQEDPPFVCNEKNIYIAFQFAGTRPLNGVPDAEPSDKLTAITIYPWLEGCL